MDSQNLGIALESWGGAILKWTDDTSEDNGLTVWNAAGSCSRTALRSCRAPNPTRMESSRG